MTQVILKQLNPIVIEKLKRLAQSHQRTLEEEITSILEDVAEKEEELKSSASIAYSNNLILVTNNVSDFEFFNDLTVENWFVNSNEG